jgi:hypothetical protein
MAAKGNQMIALPFVVPTAQDERAIPQAGERKTRDAYGRPMTYLRISLTDRCNLRCVYCIPMMRFWRSCARQPKSASVRCG